MKPKWKTTEFWVQIAALAANLFAVLDGKIPEPWAGIIIGLQAGIYAWWRHASKRLAVQNEATKVVSGEVLELRTARSVGDEVRESLAAQMEPLTKSITKAAAEAAHEGAALASEAINQRIEDVQTQIRERLDGHSSASKQVADHLGGITPPEQKN